MWSANTFLISYVNHVKIFQEILKPTSPLFATFGALEPLHSSPAARLVSFVDMSTNIFRKYLNSPTETKYFALWLLADYSDRSGI